jgi:hypothetical protein
VTGRISGHARIRGVDHEVDVVDTGDRSWGVRKERGVSNVAWFHGSFGPEFTFHVLAATDPAVSKTFGKALSGYVLENRKVTGLAEVSGGFSAIGVVTTGVDVQITDARGKQFHMVGVALNGAPWAPVPSALYTQSYMRWVCDGRVGYGVSQQSIDRGYATLHRDRLAAA